MNYNKDSFFSEQEAMKFKGEANILATKLDEVFERLNSLESELADAENKVSALMNEKRDRRKLIRNQSMQIIEISALFFLFWVTEI